MTNKQLKKTSDYNFQKGKFFFVTMMMNGKRIDMMDDIW